MNYKYIYKTPSLFDDLILYSDGEYLTGIYFIKDTISNDLINDLHIFEQTKRWLDIYFKGQNPSFVPKYKMTNVTHFQKEVFDILKTIPYGITLSYNDIAKIIAKNRCIKRMSAQAVGHAISLNPISIIIPCHRVIGTNGDMIGYAGGLSNKIELLKLEAINNQA